MDRHPVRLVVGDDLQRSRLTVFFRLLLAIPHAIWFLLWSIVALLAAIANWVAVLATGRSPAGLHGHLSRYIRYSVHVGAYVMLAANPYPPFSGAAGAYPVDVEIDPPEPQRRWTALLRILLALPALALSSVLGTSRSSTSSTGFNLTASFGGGLVATTGILGWFASLATGRMPLGLRNAGAYGIGYQAQAMAYALCLTGRYPYSGPEPGAPCSPGSNGSGSSPAVRPAPPAVHLSLDDDLRRSRLTVFFRPLLTVPHLVWLALWGLTAFMALLVAWIAGIVTGRVPAGLHGFLARYVRYSVHVHAFALLVANPFPGFGGAPGSYPVAIEIDGPVVQSRWRILLRGLLAVPAFILAGSIFNIGATAACLLWFVGSAKGRAPQGLRNAGAYGVRYAAETHAYALLLTQRYPYAGPEAGFAAAAGDALADGKSAAAATPGSGWQLP